MRILDDARSVLRVSEVLDTQTVEPPCRRGRCTQNIESQTSSRWCDVKLLVGGMPAQIRLTSELSDLSDDDNAENKTYESRILEGESSSDESDEEKRGNILNGKTILDHSLP
ncbi:hypothetical protein TNCV_1739591 [Trichonephila clavipes]|nr:hypothetical protein TNCV_1739591 [Trichonephila clavipes]